MRSEKSAMFSFWLPNDLREKLEKIARKEGRSLGNLIVFYLREAIKSE